jgi:sec-independent protein translocase protein TatA
MFSFADIFGIGTPELIVVLVILLLLFGAKKLPELSKSLGQSARELKKGLNEDPKNENKQDTSNKPNETQS